MELAIAAAALALALVACAGLAFLILHRTETHELESKVRTLGIEVADLVDRLQIWQRRDAARQRRTMGGDDPQSGGGDQAQLFQLDGPARKAAIRARLAASGMRGGK